FVLLSVLKVMTPYNPLSGTKESKADLVAFLPQAGRFLQEIRARPTLLCTKSKTDNTDRPLRPTRVFPTGMASGKKPARRSRERAPCSAASIKNPGQNVPKESILSNR